LFVGNISRNARAEEVEKEFKNFGPCKLKFKGSYAFIEYDEERDAEDAVRAIQNKSIGGRELNIEWSKNSGRYDASRSSKRRKRSISPRRKDIRDERCYKCGHRGHFAYDCRDSKRKSHRNRSRSRSRSRKHKKRSDSRHRNRSNSRSDRKKHKKRSVSSKSSSKSNKSSSPKKEDKSPVRGSKSADKKDIIENNITPLRSSSVKIEEKEIKNEVQMKDEKNEKLINEIIDNIHEIKKITTKM